MGSILVKDGTAASKLIKALKDPKEDTYSWLHTAKDFKIAVSQGLVEGWELYRKFGYNPEITPTSDPEDIVQFGGVVPTDAWGTAPITSIGSDDAANAGITVLVSGNDIDNNAVTFPMTLGTGQTTLTTPLWKIHRIFVLGATALATNSAIFAYTGTGAVPSLGDSTIRAYVSAIDNQTQQLVWTVPEGKVFMLFDSKAGIIYASGPASGDEYATLKFQTQAYDGLFTTKQYVSVNTRGSSTLDEQIENYPLVAGRSTLKLLIWEVSETVGIWGEFTGFIIDEDQFSDATLASIRQPGY